MPRYVLYSTDGFPDQPSFEYETSNARTRAFLSFHAVSSLTLTLSNLQSTATPSNLRVHLPHVFHS